MTVGYGWFISWVDYRNGVLGTSRPGKVVLGWNCLFGAKWISCHEFAHDLTGAVAEWVKAVAFEG